MTPQSQKDIRKKIGLIAAEFENTDDRYVLPIALKLERWREVAWLTVVRPVFDEFESSLEQWLAGWKGPRGKLYYFDSEVDVLLYLTEEGGRRDVRISRCRLTPAQCKLIEGVSRQVWTQEGSLPRQVEKLLESLDLTTTSY
jgi:hypothetical protein